MSTDPIIGQIMDHLRASHGCHTIILYGSRARGDARPGSDYDVMGVREAGEQVRDARLWNGVYLDLFIYPESALLSPDESMLKMQGGRVLCQKEQLGDTFLAEVDAIFRAGPRPLPADEQQARRTWAAKMLARVRAGDTEANYRRVWLLTTLLEDYFQLRCAWYLGPKRSFIWLKTNDPATFAAFDSALQPDASIATLASLVEKVAGL